jgi:hypothetical protein
MTGDPGGARQFAMADVTPPIARSRAHEAADVDGPRIWRIAGALAATLVIVAIGASVALRLFHLETGRALSATNAIPTRMPAPPLQSAPPLDLAALREQKRALLNEYRWIDRDSGIARIPIDRAMTLLIARNAGKPK